MSEQADNMDLQGAIPHPVDSTGRITLKKSEAAAMRRALGIEDGAAFELISTHEVLPRHSTDPDSTDDAFGCVIMFAPEQWRTFSDEIKALPMLDPRASQLRRLYIGGACKLAVDKQDRLKLTSNLMTWAGLTSGMTHATLLFTGVCWELWETQAYLKHMGESAAAIEAYKTAKWGDVPIAPAEDTDGD